MLILYTFVIFVVNILCNSLEAKSKLYYAGRRLGSGVGYYSHAYGIPGLGPFDPYAVDI